MAKRAILESWCYTRRNGAASILAESRPIPGNSRWCSAWLNPREGGGVLSYTSGQQVEVVLFEVLRLYQGSVVDCIYQVKSRFCLYQVTSKILFIPGHFQDSVYTRSLPRFCLYQVVFFYSHQRPWAGLDDLRHQLLVGRLLSRPLCLGVGRGSSGYTTPGLSLKASPASRVRQVI